MTRRTSHDHNAAHTHLRNAILVAIGNLPDVQVWAMNPQSPPDAITGRVFRCGPVGMADIVGIVGPRGRFVAIELKTGRGMLSDDQKRWHALVLAQGGIAIVARSVDDAMRAIEEARGTIAAR